MFSDRLDAARQLAGRFKNYQGKHPLVLGIPRGAVPMAHLIANELNGAFDVVLVRKLRAPGQAELAIGSVDESGWTYLSDDAQANGGAARHAGPGDQAGGRNGLPGGTPYFRAVGQFYQHFDQVDDEEVIEILKKS